MASRATVRRLALQCAAPGGLGVGRQPRHISRPAAGCAEIRGDTFEVGDVYHQVWGLLACWSTTGSSTAVTSSRS